MAKEMTPYDSLESVLDAVRTVIEFSDLPITSIEQKGFFGNTPLIVAAGWGNSDAVRILLDAGADINATGEDRDTALHCAVAVEALDVVQMLIDRGASVEIADAFGDTPRDFAEEAKDLRIRELLRRTTAP
jgi:ankyrin repeat protein